MIMGQDYYDTTVKMEQAGVDQDFIIGWQCGYLLNPMREEQRVTDAYEAGYEKGKARETDGFDEWIKN